MSNGNQIMKFGKLIEYNMRIIFLERSYTKCCREASPGYFSKKSKLTIFLDQQFEVSYSFFLFYAQAKGYQNILNLRCWPLATHFLRDF